MRRRTFALILVLLAVFAIGITMGRLLPVQDQTPRPSPAPAAAITRAPSEPLPIPDELGADERNGIEIYRRASGSVVHITTRALQRSFFSELYEVPQGTGSGFFWDDQGHVVTNFHVIEGANAFTVTMADHSDWEAKLVGAAPD